MHLADDGTFAGYTDALVRNPKVDTTPHLTADEATDLAVLSVGGWHTVTGSPNVDLVIVPDPRGAHLTWRVQIAQFEPGAAPAAPLVFVDAHSGEEVLSYNNLRTDFPHDTSPHDPDDYTAYDTYDAQEQTSDDFSDYRLALVGDTIAETAHQNVGLSLAYFWNAHERKSFDDDLDDDGNGAVVNSAVHYDYQYVNAFWYLDALYFGDGDGVYSDALVSLDIVAHELSHGVTEYSADLIYQDESGALNEATSDMFAAAVEAVNGGSFTDIWWVGEDIWLDGDALRYMNDPALAGDPDYYPDRLIGYEDNGYVHWNSGIANLWFHLLSEGGIHPRGKTINVVTGIGIENAADIWYDALVHRMTPGTTFPEARDATLATAAVFDAAGGTAYAASVADAWDAVGVYQITITVLSEVDVPAQATDGEFRTSIDSFDNDGIRFDLDIPDDGSSDADLYVRFGAQPTLDHYDCRPYTIGNVEECIFDPGQDGTYHVMVQAYSAHPAGTLIISSINYGASCEGTDSDGDGVCDDVDPCPLDNPDDTDGDGVCD
ncbi:MAG: M4 family metallopeptidase, partial [Deltaproteobacteria bacterium]|nr:M4 family metallopeptidase [Deltaproteobacteria bacterium]